MSKTRTLNPYDMEERINKLEEDVTSNKTAIDVLSATVAKGRSVANDGTPVMKKVTLVSPYQQLLVTVLTSAARSVYLISQLAASATLTENIFTTPNQTPVAINATRVDNTSFTFTLPPYARVNILSTEGFTVSNYTP